ncbi:MAG TPA: VOC family protein [Thermoanaerobaculia bacterium]|nr:VOC family protein [Thermoanaerobaculia bacterium]
MVKTYGLTHIALTVKDKERAFAFYRDVFGAVEVFRDEGSIQASTPGAKDVLAFEEGVGEIGTSGGIAHFGFRLVSPRDIDAAVREAKRAGGRLLRRGEFSPGFPFAYVADPDGYEIEIWYE